MRQTKQEIEKQLQHKRELITILSARQRPLELQAAQKGINTPPEILTEISTLTDQIRAQEEEIARLESLAAEGQISLAEAEFRVMLAKTWDTLSGRPTIVGDTRLELTRLQLGLTSERATELEYEVRTALAEEIFYKIDISPLLGENTGIPNSIGNTNINIAPEGENTISISNLEVHHNMVISNPLESALQMIGKAIRLDTGTALQLFLKVLPLDANLDLDTFQILLLSENRVWINAKEQPAFEAFIDNVTLALNKRKSTSH